MAKTFANIRDMAEQILEDSGNAIFSTTVLDEYIKDALAEISEYVPLMVTETVHARDGSYELDISGISDLLWIDKGEWELDWEDDTTSSRYRKPYSKSAPRYRNVNKVSETRAYLGVDSRPAAHKDEELTGTITFSDGSKAITGSGTAFLTELEVGDYIRKSTGTEWYRVAFIASNTALTLAREVESDEDGADTADATHYWHSPVWLYCAKVHRLNEMTTLTGAVDLSAGYADRLKTIHIDTLQTSGTIKKGTTFTFATIDGVYTITEDATIATNECDISFYPGLSAAVADGDAITFETSTLDPRLERLLADLVAARAAINWMGKGRTQLVEAVNGIADAMGALHNISARVAQAVADVSSGRTEGAKIATAITTANTSTDNMTARITQAVTDVGSGRTEADKIPAAVALINSSIDSMAARLTQAATDIASGRTEAAKILTAITLANAETDKMATEVALAVADLASGRTEAAKIPAAITNAGTALGNVSARITQQIADIVSGRTEAAKTVALISSANTAIGLMNAEVDRALTALQSGVGYINTIPQGGRPDREYLQYAGRYIDVAKGYFSEASAYLAQARSDESVARSYAGLATAEMQSAAAYVAEAQGYIAQAAGDAGAARAYAGLAGAEVQSAIGYLRTASGYLAEARADNVATQAYIALGMAEVRAAQAYATEARGYAVEANADGMAARVYQSVSGGELQAARAYLAQSSGYLAEGRADDMAGKIYLAIGAAELRAAQTSLNEGMGFLREVMSRLNIARGFTAYQGWGQSKLTEVKAGLRRLVKPRQQTLYSRS